MLDKTEATERTDAIAQVLVVDDEPNMRETLCEILRVEGYTVSSASSGEEAVALCSQGRYEIVLMDVRMPGITGVDAFRQIRRHRPDARVILMSGLSETELKRQALGEGAVAFLAKPLDIDQAIRLIAEVRDTVILIVEDDAGTVSLLSEELSQRGYRVTVTSSPNSALELVEQIRFDLIFIDTKLPTMNGLQLYLAIKKIVPSSVAIMISGREQEFMEIARAAVQQSAYCVVRKPLDIGHVLSLLESVTGQRASHEIVKPRDSG